MPAEFFTIYFLASLVGSFFQAAVDTAIWMHYMDAN